MYVNDGGVDPIYRSSDRRSSDAPYEHDTLYDFLEDFIQAGLAQVALLAAPMYFALALTPVYVVEIGTAGVVSVLALSVLITLFRGGHVRVGPPWPVLTSKTFSTDAGWTMLATRAAYLSCTVGFAAYGGVLAELATGSYLANVAAVVLLAAAAVVLLPYLSRTSTRTRVARLGYCAIGPSLATLVLLLSGAPPGSGVVTSLGAVVVLVAIDARPLLASTRRRAGHRGE